ncbi:MAG: exodeoxyribonuclease V subunit gamma [Clostridia bacterium]|nr:exodeoxyribonuclease V subunit gamma [Clostridia bacterium]
MLHLITGRTGFGKTEYALNLIEKIVRDGESVALIVPEQASFFYERKILHSLGAKDAQRAETLSFSRVAENILTHKRGGKKPLIDDGGRIVLMSLALESLSEKLNVYKKYIKSISVANQLLKLTSEFKRCMVTPLDLYKTAGAMDNCFLKEKLSEIALIAETYDALVAQSFSDDTDNLTLLAEELSTNTYFSGKTVFIDSFNGFTVQEYEVISKILVWAKDVYINLCTDSVTAEMGEDFSVFAYVRNTASKLIKTANRYNVRVASPVRVTENIRFDSDALSALEEILCADESIPYDGNADDITVATAPDVYEECAYVASNVKRLIREEGIRCRDIAVLYRNADRYERSVKSALIKCGVPVFEDKRQPIASQPLITLIRTVCDIAANGFSYENIMRFLKTGLVGVSDEETAEIENYALTWRINGDRWTMDFTSSPKGLGNEITDEDLEALQRLNAVRRKVTEPLAFLKTKVKNASGRDISEAIYRFLIHIKADENLKILATELYDSGERALATEQERVWDMAMSVLNMLALTIGDRPVGAVRYFELFNAVISTATLGNIPHGLDEVAVGSIDRTVTTSPRVVFVMGANEGEFPKKTENTGMLNDADRKYLKELGIELYDFGESKSLEERFLVYKTLSSARERLFVSYSGATADGVVLAPSSVIRTLEEKFPSCRKVDFSAVSDIDKIEGVIPAFETLCLESVEKDGIYKELSEWFSAESDYSGKMEALSRITDKTAFKINDKQTATELFGKNMYLSASRVEKYYNCPFSYFCLYGLMARPRATADFDAATQGTEIHFILEKLLRDYGKDGLVAMSEEERAEKVNELLYEYLVSKMGTEEKTDRFMYLYNRLQKSIGEILARLIMEFRKSSFVPVDFELKIDRDGEVMPYTTTMEDGSTVSLKGIVDRVDMMELNGKKYIRIVDYKSGKKEFKLSDVFDGLNMQMILYLFAIWENGSTYYGENIIPSGFLYMPARAEYVKPERDEKKEDIELKKAKSLRMNGMILNDETVIVGMDEGVSGCFVPVERGKDGFKSDSLISLHQLSLLKRKVDETIEKMATQLKNGNIRALPVTGSNHSACDYCDYRSVCGHEDGKGEKQRLSGTNSHFLSLLQGEAKEE